MHTIIIKTPDERVITGYLTKAGYYVICIRKRVYRTHRLIAAAFLPSPGNEQNVINHINGVRYDNRIENLEYVTCSGNTQHALDTGLMKTRKAVKKYTLAGEFLQEFPSITDAGKSIGERKHGAIGQCCIGRNRSAYGFVWKFSNDSS